MNGGYRELSAISSQQSVQRLNGREYISLYGEMYIEWQGSVFNTGQRTLSVLAQLK